MELIAVPLPCSLAAQLCTEIGIFIIGWLTDRKDPSNPDSPATWPHLAIATRPQANEMCREPVLRLKQDRSKLKCRLGFGCGVACQKVLEVLSHPFMPPNQTFHPVLHGICPAFSKAWLYMILVSVTLAVAAIPEGIPLCVTISLLLGLGAFDFKEQNLP